MGFSTERLILSVSKYSRYIFRGRNAQFSIETRQEKGRVECLWEFQIFHQGIIAQIFGKNICYSKSPISPWRGPQWKSLFWAFLLNSLWSPSTQKISFHWAPLLAFPNVWLNIFKFCFLNICCNFWGKISGSKPCQSNFIWTNMPFFRWEIRPYFWTFLGWKKRPNGHLNL